MTTETLLLAFLCYKSETRRELIQDYLTELNTLSPVLNQNDTPNLEDTFEETDLDQGIVLLKNLSKINDPNQQVILDKNYETIMLTLMLMNQKLPVALMSRYHYRGQKSVASCVETTFHNLWGAFQ